MNNMILEKISAVKLIPVVKIDDLDTVKPLVKALSDGGLNIIEITYRTACAKEAIKIAVNEFPDLIIGAGTVTKLEQAVEAVGLGAKFIVSPGLNDEIAAYCNKDSVLYLGGAVTPTEIMRAVDLGLNIIKFFPAESFGGLKMIKALSGPFPNLKFMPTGGIDISNIKEYLNFNKIIACGGSWMVKDSLITSKNYIEITKLAKDALKEINS